MEAASEVAGGVVWELTFFVSAFFLGFCLRMGYDILWLFRRLVRHKRFFVGLEDFFFWVTGSVLMFGLMFRENNGTPRLFAILGALAGMFLYHIGPGSLFRMLTEKILGFLGKCQKKIRENVGKLLKKRKKQGRIKKEANYKE